MGRGAVCLAAWLVVPSLLALTPAPPMGGAGSPTADAEGTPATRADANVPPATPAPAAESAPGIPPGSPGATLRLGSWRVTWDDGVRFELGRLVPLVPEHAWLLPPLDEGRPAVSGTLGLKLQVDAAAYGSSSSLPDVAEGVELRRGRVFAAGEFFFVRPIDFKVEFGVRRTACSSTTSISGFATFR